MQFEQTTILGFFDSTQKTYEIPVYQRAYSWNENHWEIFIADLEEQIEGDNNYFFGNILLEEMQKNIKYEIIDGQQRITTLTIFFRAIINILSERFKCEGKEEIDLKEKESLYIKVNGKRKLNTVAYDQNCFDTVIIENNNSFRQTSSSQERIVQAKSFFEKKLRSFETEKIIKILNKIEETELNIIKIQGKKEAALMFELENNRGKALTNMEKLKSYFMYQMYNFSNSDSVDQNIEYISNIFKDIYLVINDIKSLEEDSILFYNNVAYINGYSYRTLDDLKAKLKKANDKVRWIKEYINELKNSFLNIKRFENCTEEFAQKIKNLKLPAYIYPFIIKAYKYNDATTELNKLFKIMEIVIFRAKLINSRANIQDRLNMILMNYEGDNDKLRSEIKEKLNNELYWSDETTKNYLNGNMYANKILNYLLWEYENSLQNPGYLIRSIQIEDEEIEHISPQNIEGTYLESGYESTIEGHYTEEFIDQRLNSLGNLMLISKSHNSSIGNKPFEQKLNSYINNPILKQQQEIKTFAEKKDDKFFWKENSIIKRQNKLISFALLRWSL
ncbi:MAG: DUF262 domain-containing protein [Pleomorphochaeta sp.]